MNWGDPVFSTGRWIGQSRTILWRVTISVLFPKKSAIEIEQLSSCVRFHRSHNPQDAGDNGLQVAETLSMMAGLPLEPASDNGERQWMSYLRSDELRFRRNQMRLRRCRNVGDRAAGRIR
jgi:hypothetical protein